MAVAAVAGACGAWLSQGTLALATPDGPRMALLPLSAGAVLLSIAAGTGVAALVWLGASLTPLALVGFLVLPWLPLELPPALLVWTGPLTLPVWVAIVWNMRPRLHARLLPGSAAVRAGVLGLLIFGGAAWCAAPSIPGGDEPHYLVITQSLLYDRDLKIENNHRRGDYQTYFGAPLRPDYLRRGLDGEIYSIHAPGLSALVAPAFAAGGYPGTVLFLVLLSAAGSALLWQTIWLATGVRSASWFGWAAVSLSATHVFLTFTIYPDGVGGLLTLTGILALLRAEEERRTGSTKVARWSLHGAALALLPWLHTRFALLAGCLGALILLRLGRVSNPAAKAAAFLSVPALSALCWLGYFVAIYGTADPSAPYGSAVLGSPANIPGGLAGLLFDQRFGLIAHAPVLVISVVGLVAMLRDRWPVTEGAPRTAPAAAGRRLACELLFLSAPYVLTVTNFTMWWAGWSPPARFAAPLLPVLGVAAGFGWLAIRHRATRAVAAGALVMTAFITTVLLVPGRGALAFNTRMAPGLWLEWAAPLADLAAGVPDWFREPPKMFIVDVAVWLGVLTGGWLALRMASRARPLRRPATLATAGVALYLALSMLALTMVWKRHAADGFTHTTSQMAYLRRLADEPAARALQIAPPAMLDRRGILSAVKIWARPQNGRGGGANADDRPLLVLRGVPAGQYHIRPRTRAAGGSLIVGVGVDQFALRTQALEASREPLLVDLPVQVRALVVRGDERARQVVRRIDVEPVSLRAPAEVPSSEFARHAVRYGAASVFFVDERSYPEPEAFWVAGGGASSVVVQPDTGVKVVPLLLRNAPVVNDVVVTSGAWRREMRLAPGDERRLDVPLAADAALIRFHLSSGFRPSEVDPESRDDRFLGLWVRPELP